MRKLFCILLVLVVTGPLLLAPGRAHGGARTVISALPETNASASVDLLIIDSSTGGTNFVTRKITITNLFLGTHTLIILTSNALVKSQTGFATNFTAFRQFIADSGANNAQHTMIGSNFQTTLLLKSYDPGISGIDAYSPANGSNGYAAYALAIPPVGSGGLYAGPYGHTNTAVAFFDTSGSANVITNRLIPIIFGQAGLWNNQTWADYGRFYIATNGDISFHRLASGQQWAASAFHIDATKGPLSFYSSASNIYAGPGTIAIDSAGIVTGSGTSFLSTFKWASVFFVGGQGYNVIYVNSDTSMRVGPAVTQSAGTAYNVYPDSIRGFDTSGEAAGFGVSVTATGELNIKKAVHPRINLIDAVNRYSIWTINHDGNYFSLTTTQNGTDRAPFFISDLAGNNSFILDTAGILSATNGLATGGNIMAKVAGGGLQIKTGSNARIGRSTLVAGTLAVANTSVTANTKVFLTGVGTDAAAPGRYTATTSAGVGFTIYSSVGGDTASVDWLLVEGN